MVAFLVYPISDSRTTCTHPTVAQRFGSVIALSEVQYQWIVRGLYNQVKDILTWSDSILGRPAEFKDRLMDDIAEIDECA